MQDSAPTRDPAEASAETAGEDGATEAARAGTAEFPTLPESERPDEKGPDEDEGGTTAAPGPATGTEGAEGAEAPEASEPVESPEPLDAAGAAEPSGEAEGAESAPESAPETADEPVPTAVVFNNAGQWTIPAPPPASPPAQPEPSTPEQNGPEQSAPEPDAPMTSGSETVPEIDPKISPAVAPETVPEIDVAAARPRPGSPAPEPEPAPEPAADPAAEVEVEPEPAADPVPVWEPEPEPVLEQPAAPERPEEPGPPPAPPQAPAQAPSEPRGHAAPPPTFPALEYTPPPPAAPETARDFPAPQEHPAAPEYTPPQSFQPPHEDPLQGFPPPPDHRAPHNQAPPQQHVVQEPEPSYETYESYEPSYETARDHPPVQDYGRAQEYAPQQDYAPQDYAPHHHQQYAPQQDYAPQQEYAPQEYPQQDYAQQGYAPAQDYQQEYQQEYEREYGHQAQAQAHAYAPAPEYQPEYQRYPEQDYREGDHQEHDKARDFNAAYEAAAGEVPGRKKRRRGLIAFVVVLVLLAGAAGGQLLRPLPEPSLRLTLASSSHTFPGAAPVLPLPMQGQSALYVEGLGNMGASGGGVPTPTASVAKVMTAYVFLRDHPLAPGQQGPVYTVSQQAAAQIPQRTARGESLLGVTAGMRLTERKALEALMVISANDVAHELARWDSGDPRLFVKKMNDAARSLGMTSTTYTDPSGYHSGTVSTAADQVKLLRAAMKIPAFAEIVAERAYVPGNGGAARAGGNVLLGQYGVVGGKTGYTDAAGGNYVFTARRRVGGVTTTFYGAVMGQQSSSAMGALTVGRDLLAAAGKSLTAVTLAQAGARVGQVSDGLGGSTPLRASSAVTVVGWPGLTVRIGADGDVPRTASEGTRIGTLKAGSSSVPLVLDRTLREPSLLTRLIRLR
ncbi:hypothetical protein ACFY4C_06070 [Actinomadura viridis]|uniref:D-alanyl-D-alanine carboxypeptidase n=1 Tax=Actinomadura viridis TaxID=58110 RepID=UPI0036850004